MRKELYMDDSYMTGFESTVQAVKDGKFITLDKTAFYPDSGGQPHDEGTLTRKSDGKEFKVVYVGKFSGAISHEVEGEGLKAGDVVEGKIDWQKRFKLMRMHTAAHVISGLIHVLGGAMITGNQLNLDKSRIDFSLDNYDPNKMQEYIDDCNKLINKDLKIKVTYITREQAEKIPKLSKLATGLPKGIEEIRLIDIVGFDVQADGGTHVSSLKEIGKIKLIKCDNKGKNNRRLYFELED